MKYPCPKCLMNMRDRHNDSHWRLLIDRALSKVCNAAPVAPQEGDLCCCGAGWIPCMPDDEF